MTIEQFAQEQGLPKITRYTLKNGVHVYRLHDGDEDACVGLPVYALETADGWRLATADETFVIMDALDGDDE
jgi:hypothetical protein